MGQFNINLTSITQTEDFFQVNKLLNKQFLTIHFISSYRYVYGGSIMIFAAQAIRTSLISIDYSM